MISNYKMLTFLAGASLWSTILVAAPGSNAAQYYRPVGSLYEVPAGQDYGLRQPPVESATALAGKRVALLAAHGVEDEEISFPLEYLLARGAEVDIVAPAWSNGKVLTVEYTRPYRWVTVTKTLSQARSEVYDLVLVTGGPWDSGVLRNDPDALAIVRSQAASNRLLATICSGSQVLIDSGLAGGVTLTGAPNVKIDLIHAGAGYLDQDVVIGEHRIYGRDPRAMPSFMTAIREALLQD